LFIALGILLLVSIVYFYFYAASLNIIGPTVTSSPVPTAIDGASGAVVSASGFPAGQVSDYGLQYWMYIDNWTTGSGKKRWFCSARTRQMAQS
jgi:hypothetical protein